MSLQPVIGFHFSVEIEISPQDDLDLRFQEVSGLSQELATEDLTEGGENRFSHALPTRSTYQNLVLKRGFVKSTALIEWAKRSIENIDIVPANVLIKLLNENTHEPVASWYVINAYPVKWSFSNFNAQDDSIVVETMEFKYQYYTSLLN